MHRDRNICSQSIRIERKYRDLWIVRDAHKQGGRKINENMPEDVIFSAIDNTHCIVSSVTNIFKRVKIFPIKYVS